MKRYIPVELGVSGSMDLAHAAFADLSGDFVDVEAVTRADGHGGEASPDYSDNCP